ncbi:hypothetical protein EIP91_011159 [Steccherinum ochraceum]|uniref:MOSC domain-containing protein n=1 Tax=Steccherinum ochraceum TaxID=92696 RepID=A0A4R0RI94_9APHY|nr:hypothetical protein EIP91_011159 [Steccherinum ochraceum]
MVLESSADYLLPWTVILIVLSVLYGLWSKNIRSTPRRAMVDLSKVDTSNPLVNRHVQKEDIRLDSVTVSKILIHPLKSCRGTSVPEARYTPRGLQYDREWCIIDAETHDVLTARTLASTVLVHPRLEIDPNHPYGGFMIVDVPKASGDSGYTSFSVPIKPTPDVLASWPHITDVAMFKVDIMDGYIVQPLKPSDPNPHHILSAYFKRDVLLMMKGPEDRYAEGTDAFPTLEAYVKYQDAYPLLIASEESLQAINDAKDRAVDADDTDPSKVSGIKKDKWNKRKIEIERFRPNIVLKGAGVPFAEDLWREISVGNSEQSITVVCRCARCLLPNVDTKTGERDTAVPYKVMMKFGIDRTRSNKPMFGCNGVPEGNGVIRVGDRVTVKEWIEEVA